MTNQATDSKLFVFAASTDGSDFSDRMVIQPGGALATRKSDQLLNRMEHFDLHGHSLLPSCNKRTSP